jgi:two-component system sensor histidine kinase UhpB
MSYSRVAEVERNLQERGQTLAHILAPSSEYAVASGDLTIIRHTLDGLLRHDPSIVAVQVQDSHHATMVEVHSGTARDNPPRYFEEPIRAALLPVDDVDTPQVSSGVDSTSSTGPLIGYVKVELSSSLMAQAQRQRLLVGSSLAACALLLSILLGIYLTAGVTGPLAATVQILRRIRTGNYAVQLLTLSGGEIGLLQSSIIDMAASLEQYRTEMEAKVEERTQDLRAARDEALKSNAEKRMLIQRVNSAVEDERKSIAAELHDHLNAMLIVVRLEAQRILQLSTDQEHPHPTLDQIQERAQSTIDLVTQLYSLCRNLVKNLRPEAIEMVGLQGAAEEMVRTYDELHPACAFRFATDGDLSGLPADLSINAFRLVQEALSNVVKHANASGVDVLLSRKDDRQILYIGIRDNGKGFDTSEPATGIGLISMRERVDGYGGTLRIRSGSAEGTRISITLPIPTPA